MPPLWSNGPMRTATALIALAVALIVVSALAGPPEDSSAPTAAHMDRLVLLEAKWERAAFGVENSTTVYAKAEARMRKAEKGTPTRRNAKDQRDAHKKVLEDAQEQTRERGVELADFEEMLWRRYKWERPQRTRLRKVIAELARELKKTERTPAGLRTFMHKMDKLERAARGSVSENPEHLFVLRLTTAFQQAMADVITKD